MSNVLRVAHGPFGRVALLDMDRQLVRHAHPHCHVLIKVEGADTQFSVRDRIVPLTDDHAVLINAWEPHAYAHDPSRPRTIILALYIEPAWLRGFRPNWAASGAPGFFEDSAGPISPRIRALSRDLAMSLIHEPDATGRHEEQLAQLMISVIERFTPWRTVSTSLRDLAKSGVIDPRVRNAIAIMRSDPGQITTMADLARGSGMSRAQLFRSFDGHVGVPPRVVLNMLRMEMAVAAVVGARESLSVISDRLGFAAASHFTRFFRDHAGAAPSEFRSAAALAVSA